MKMPYCQTCAARVASAGRRMMGLFALVTIAAAGLPALLPMVLEVSLSPTLLAAAGAGGALVFTGLAALIFLPKKPAAPATARGEAVWVTRFPDGGDLEVFCTNPTFAAGLAEANQKPMHRATRVRWVEIVSVIWCIALSAGMVFLTWNAETSGPLAPAPAASASAAPAKASAPKPTSPAPKPAPKKK